MVLFQWEIILVVFVNEPIQFVDPNHNKVTNDVDIVDVGVTNDTNITDVAEELSLFSSIVPISNSPNVDISKVCRNYVINANNTS